MRIPGADQAVDNLMGWSRKDQWAPYLEETIADHLDPILEEYDLDQGQLIEILGPAFSSVFGAIFEDFFTTSIDEDGRTVIDDYLKRRGWREKVPGRRYLEALRDSTMSLYEVIDLDRGKTMTLRDLVCGGDPIIVHDKMGSESAALWDRLGGRVLFVNGKHYLSGGLLAFSHDAGNHLLESFEKVAAALAEAMDVEAERQDNSSVLGEADLRGAVLEESGPIIFTRMWLRDTLDRLFAPPPQMFNTDGDEILFSNVRFQIQGDESDVARAIDELENIERIEPNTFRWSWTAPGSPTQRMAKKDSETENGITLQSSDEQGRTSLGNLEIQDGTLILSTNSRERAEKGRDILAAHLSTMVGAPLISHEDVQQALKNRPVQPTPGAEEIPPEIQEQIQKQYFDDYYRQLLDDTIPSLDNKTPRQSVKSKHGRKKVVDWLKQLENGEQRRAASQGQKPYDVTWIWKELGLEGER